MTYASVLDWPIAVGHRYRRTGGCTCQDTDPGGLCPAPGAHPRAIPVEPLAADAVATAFDQAPGASIIAACGLFDVITLPYLLGAGLMVRLDRLPVHTPCLMTGQARASLLVSPGTARELSGYAGVTVRSGTHGWVALPPSHQTRWDTAPEPGQPLPRAGDLDPHLQRVAEIASREAKRPTS
ncbi:hypothetical protein [Streptomyces lasiicapitis]|nr:hypothetical protein [Streptomyces lasiicapitis]